MTDENDSNKPDHLKLVSSRPSVKRPTPDLIMCRQNAARQMQNLTANLLRVIAGAGKPEQIMSDLHEAFTAYAEYVHTAKVANQPIDDNAILNRLFLDTHFEPNFSRTQAQKIEQEWDELITEEQRPESIEYRKHQAIVSQLRKSVIRELAAAIAGIDIQRVKYESQIDDALWAKAAAVEMLRQEQRERSNPSRKKLPPIQSERWARQQTRRTASADQREKRDQRTIEHLEPHHLTALRAVATKNLDVTDSFSLDVLGRMNLLRRPKGVTTKSGWELTDLGRRALNIHGIEPR